MKYDNRYVWFDLARGISALLVCAGHLRSAIFTDYSQLSRTSSIDKAFYFLTGLGHQAVMAFFVLSGFFVGGYVMAKKKDFKFYNYLLIRLSRLWIVLIPGLIFTFIIDKTIAKFAPGILTGEYNTILNSGPKANSYSLSIETFVANIFFLQHTYAPVFGTNGPLWSLANEFWYYILFPLLIISVNGIRRSPVKRIFSIILIVIIIACIAKNMMVGFLIWLFGVIVYLIYEKRTLSVRLWITMLFAVLFAASLVDSKASFIYKVTGIENDVVVGVCFSLLLISVNNKSIQFGQKYIAKISRWLSEISYTLYVFHFPLVLLIYSLFYKEKQIFLNEFSAVQYLLWLITILLVNIIIWWLFERNTPVIRQYLQKHLTHCSSDAPKACD